MNEILRHGGGNNFPFSRTKKQQHKKKIDASVRTITANIPTFMPTKSSKLTFVFDENNVHSNIKTVYEDNKRRLLQHHGQQKQ